MDVAESKRDIPEGRIRASRATDLDIETGDAPERNGEPQRLKLYNMPNLAQKIQLWLIVILSSGSLLSNLSAIASSLGYFPSAGNHTCTCPPPQWRP